jgi:hypothetical protein
MQLQRGFQTLSGKIQSTNLSIDSLFAFATALNRAIEYLARLLADQACACWQALYRQGVLIGPK